MRWSRVAPVGTALAIDPGTPARTAAKSRSRQRRARSTRRGRPSADATAAAANPTAPATSCVPLRRSRSWPPPSSCGSMTTPPRTTRAPVPTGPPHLWDARVTRSAAAATSRTSTQHRACAASAWSTARGARSRTIDAMASRGCRVPVSLFTRMTDTKATSSSSVLASASRSTTPRPSTGDEATAGSGRRGGARRGARPRCTRTVPSRAPSTPVTARLSASVPPLVNTISPG